ncbi:MAG: hypothetical protein HFE62_01305 [Firmicutes bacterium]|nr:hypothetical protein [Bacillota bacterium]
MEKRKSALKDIENKNMIIIPIILVTTVFMFISRAKVLPEQMYGMYWHTGPDYDIDVFVYWKKMFFMTVTALALAFLLWNVVLGKRKINRHIVYIPMAVYCVFVLLSYVFSPYKAIASAGTNTRLEGTWVLIFYMLATFFAMNAVSNEKSVKTICIAFAISCTVLGFWGVLEKFAELKITSLPNFLYYPRAIRDSINVTRGGAIGYVEWFFTNMNYTSFFMVIPISIFTMASIGSENKVLKTYFAFLTGLIVFCLWGASSMGGIVATACAAIMAVVVFGFANLKKWAKSIAIVIVFVAAASAVSIPSIKNEFKNTLAIEQNTKNTSGSMVAVETELSQNAQKEEESEAIIEPLSSEKAGFTIVDAVDNSHVYINAANEIKPEFHNIDYIKTENNTATFSFEGVSFTISAYDNGNIEVTDSNGNATDEYTKYFTVSSKFSEMLGTGEDTLFLYINTPNCAWPFGMYDGKLYFITAKGEGLELDGNIKTFGFKGHEKFATNRGYIWSRSIPLIKDTIFVGHGADTFEMYFPHNDFAGKYNVGMYSSSLEIIVDKPHNMYIATAINTGLISLLALLAVYGIYIVESFKIYRKREFSSFMEYIGAGIMLAITGILVGGLVNDSVINVMAVSFTFMGVGFAINRMIKNG